MNAIKKLFTSLGELSGGILQPNNSLLFARSLLFWVIVSALIFITGLVYFQSKAQQTKPKTEVLNQTDAIMAEVGKQKIYKSDVEKLAAQTYARDAIDPNVLKIYLDVAIEQALLDNAAKEFSIQIDDEDITQRIKSEQKQDNDKNRSDIFYEILKEKVTTQVVKSRTANVVEYWTPSVSDPEIESEATDQKNVTQRQQGRKALELIATQLKETPDVLTATREVLLNNSYRELEEIIAVNGLRIAKVTNENELRKPYIFTIKDQEIMGEEFYSSLFNMKQGDIETIFRDEDSAGKLYQVIASSDGEYQSFDEWFEIKEKELVKNKVNL